MQDKYKEVLIVLIAGITLFLVLTGIVVFVLLFYQKKKFQYRQQVADLRNLVQQEILQAQLETQEYTFRQISEEIHDNVGQLLSSAKMLLGITERSLPSVPDTLQKATETIGEAIQQLRSFSKTLSTEWLNQFDFIGNIRHELERITASGIVTGYLDTEIVNLPFSPQEQVMLFRVLQEALQNSIKHARPANIRVSAIATESRIFLKLEDDGQGFDPQASRGSGIGMINMRHRIRLLNGEIQWESGENTGTKVTICLPLNN